MAYDPRRLELLARGPLGAWLSALPIRYFRATLEGHERLLATRAPTPSSSPASPTSGGALLVGNHALFGLDAFVLASLLIRETGRIPRFLGERNLFRVPGLATCLDALGAIAGEPDTATELLRAGELVVVYPGGIDDSFKPSSERYELKWGKRAGFARIAMRAKVPILPVGGLGIDDMYTVVGRERWLGRTLLGSPRYDLPIAFGAYGTLVPRRHSQVFELLAPVETHGDPDDPNDVERVRREVHDALARALARGPRKPRST